MVAFLAWFEVNKKRVIVGTGVGVVVLFSAFLWFQHEAQKEVFASQALSDVRVPFSAAGVVPAGTTEALIKVANEHRGTKAAARALLLCAGVQFSGHTDQGYTEAHKLFAQLLQEYPNTPWAAEANLGVAASLAALGRTNEAMLKYEEIRKRFANAPIIDDAKIALARLYESQKPEEAFRLYDDLAKGGMAAMSGGGMGSASAMEASMRLDDLMKRHPELAKLREPIAPPRSVPPITQTLNLTNRAVTSVQAGTNAAAAAIANAQRILLTNRPAGTGTPVPIKLSTQPPKP
jgi:predicted negative regulator of RcsB-dependent stress response